MRKRKIISQEIEMKLMDDYIKGMVYKENSMELYNIGWNTVCKIRQKHNILPRKACGALKKYKNKLYSLDDEYFSNIDTENKAYWLGFIQADGNISKQPSNVLAINLAGKDIGHLQKLLIDLKSNNKIYECIVNGHNVVRLSICNKQICKDLIKHGIVPAKSLIDKFFPVPEKFEKSFWRGIFDGDGSIGWAKRYNCYYGALSLNGTNSLILQFKEFLKKHGLDKGAISEHYNISKFKVIGTTSVLDIINLLYTDATVFLDRKYKISLSIINTGSRREF